MPIVFKFILNIFFYLVYSLIGIFLLSLSYGGFLYYSGRNIPSGTDPIHLKIAIMACLIVLLISLILRKYFYISFSEKKK